LTIRDPVYTTKKVYHDRNGSDLILNYQFSDETESKLEEGAILIEGEEPEDQPKVDLSSSCSPSYSLSSPSLASQPTSFSSVFNRTSVISWSTKSSQPNKTPP
jgi:hypothetical protein